jgi:hypothetical protein
MIGILSVGSYVPVPFLLLLLWLVVLGLVAVRGSDRESRTLQGASATQ